MLTPVGPLVSTLVFIACLAAILASERDWLALRQARCRRWTAVLGGAGVGIALVLPLAVGAPPHRGLEGFWVWAAAIALLASMEESVLRGPLQTQWSSEAGPGVAVLVTALVFAAMHLPVYGAPALPLDFAVGVALGGLRMLTGRILPSALAHVLADWGAWFWF